MSISQGDNLHIINFNLLVVGSRTVVDEDVVFPMIDEFIEEVKCELNKHYSKSMKRRFSLFDESPEDKYVLNIKIISGGANGVDTMAECYADIKGHNKKIMPADWDRYKRGAGYRRNIEMVKKADGCLAIWDGQSNGTRHTISLCEKKGILLSVKTVTVKQKQEE